MEDLTTLFLAIGATTLNAITLCFFSVSLYLIKKQLKREGRWEKFQKFVKRRFDPKVWRREGKAERDKPKGEARA